MNHGITTSTCDRDVDSVTEHVSESDCWALLRGQEVGRLALATAGDIDIFPLNYLVDGASLVFRTDEGTKLIELVLSARCAFEVDGYDPVDGKAWSVVIKGWAVLLDRASDVDAVRSLPLSPWHAGPKERFVRITPERMTGRRFVARRD